MDDRAGPPDVGDPGHKLAVLRERLLSAAGAIRATEDWTAALHAVARLPGESFANILLIEAERPGATLVKGYGEWQAAGLQVSRGEHGIEVFSATRGRPSGPARGLRGRPAPEPPAPGWRDASRVAYVWDISQASGPPMTGRDPLHRAAGEASPGLWEALCWLARREGLAVEREHGAPADGVTFWAAHRIRVLPGLEPSLAAWALAHQLGHVMMHGALARSPGETTSGDACTGIRKADADAVAFITCARYGIALPHQPASPGTWAGTDPRAQPAAVILAAGERIAATFALVARHLDGSLHGAAAAVIQPPARHPASRLPRQRRPGTADAGQATRPAVEPAVPASSLYAVLSDAGAFYCAGLSGSWVPGYLRSRGLSPDSIGEWQAGYAPAGWSELTGHLRAAGYADEEIEAAGLARRSSRGTLIDLFRDRVMLPVRDQAGRVAGFTGRASPGAGPQVPRYLNSPETSLYKKGGLLYGLHEGRSALAAGATPVIVEGPFDAIAVTLAGTGRVAGLAPCGTALTTGQAALLATACDLSRAGVVVALDDDPAGRKAATRAYAILRPHAASVRLAGLPSGRDPAQVLQEDGPQALLDALTARARPLLGVIVDADVRRWEGRLGDVEGPVRAMRSAAAVLAGLLPASSAAKVRQAAGGRVLATVDEDMRPVTHPQVPAITQVLPADTASQALRLATRLGLPVTDVIIEVANAVTRQAAKAPARKQSAATLAAGSFPAGPADMPGEGVPVKAQGASRPSRRRGPSHRS